MINALVIDDEPQIRRALRVGLEQNGYSVSLAENGEAGLDLAALRPPDVVILDLAMPVLDGVSVCRRLREWTEVPILVLSVREDETEKIAALDSGADDYLTKPFSLGELLARLRALLRRSGAGDGQEAPRFRVDDFEVDFARRLVTRGEREIHLTPIEYELLRQLASHAGRVVTHRQLLTRVWGPEYSEDTHTLRVHIANLRNKVERDPARPALIRTEPRVGYRFQTEP